jgi:hypothetical protein
VSRDWNIGRLPREKQRGLIDESVSYLESLLKPIDEDYRVVAFKAGSWGLQPCESLLEEFGRVDIRLVLGVRKGLVIPEVGVDYSGLEEANLPYHPRPDDLTRVAREENDFVVMPLTWYRPGFRVLARMALHVAADKLRGWGSADAGRRDQRPPGDWTTDPVSNRSALRFKWPPYTTHLKIGNQPYHYLKKSLDAVLRRLGDIQRDTVPVVIESHTKDYPGNYGNIRRFLEYMMKSYGGRVEFMTLSQYYQSMSSERECLEPVVGEG